MPIPHIIYKKGLKAFHVRKPNMLPQSQRGEQKLREVDVLRSDPKKNFPVLVLQ